MRKERLDGGDEFRQYDGVVGTVFGIMPSGRIVLGVFLALMALADGRGAEPWRVLLLHSFGQEFEPYKTFSENFRSDLTHASPQQMEIIDVALAEARFEEAPQDEPFVDYLHALYKGRNLELIVPIGGPAARFVQETREELFPFTPVLYTGVDVRQIHNSRLTSNDAVVGASLDWGHRSETSCGCCR
jgi:hypothetical protein